MKRRVRTRLAGFGAAFGLTLSLLLGSGGLLLVDLATAPAAAASSHSSSHSSKARVHLPKRCTIRGRVLCADKTRHKVYYVHNGKIERTMTAAFGRPGYLHTREGTFRITRKARHWVSTVYHSPMPYAMFFSRGQAVHYSAYFAKHPHHRSHGCINIRDKRTLAWVFSRMHVGDRVVVYRS